MRVLSEEQYDKLTEHIKELDTENQYLKKLLDDAGIPYDRTDKAPKKSEPDVISIKEEPITKELVQFFYSMFKGRKDVYSLRSGKPNAKTGKHGYYTQCDNFWKYGLCGKAEGKRIKCQTCPNQKYKGEKLKTVGDNITNVGKKFLPVTGVVTGLGTAAVKVAADFDSSMSKVAAVSGATGKDFDALRDKAREMGSKTKFSASEAAEAMNYMAMAGWKTEDMLEGIEGVMNLAAASGEDLATTSDIVTDALTAFGLSASDSGHFADILAAASSNANTNVSMMGETFKYCAPIAGALGFSAEDTAEAIGLMANAGIKGSQAGTALRTIMNNLSGDVKICGSSIGEVTVATTNADGSMRDLSDILADCRTAFAGLTESEKAQAAESLVGKNAMSGFLALMNAGEDDIDKLSSAIANCDGTAAGMAETMQDNLAGQLQILKSQLEELAISFGDLGKNPKLSQAKSKNDKNISGLLAQIESGKIGIHTFTNASAFTVSTVDTRIISIEFATTEANYAQFFGQVVVDITADAVTKTATASGNITIPSVAVDEPEPADPDEPEVIGNTEEQTVL